MLWPSLRSAQVLQSIPIFLRILWMGQASPPGLHRLSEQHYPLLCSYLLLGNIALDLLSLWSFPSIKEKTASSYSALCSPAIWTSGDLYEILRILDLYKPTPTLAFCTVPTQMQWKKVSALLLSPLIENTSGNNYWRHTLVQSMVQLLWVSTIFLSHVLWCWAPRL